jgi:hypothetical protein
MDFAGGMDSLADDDICGIDNCTSSRWTSNNNGTVSCENGHVRAGYAASDDAPEMEFETQGRKTVKKRDRGKQQTMGMTPYSPMTRIKSWLCSIQGSETNKSIHSVFSTYLEKAAEVPDTGAAITARTRSMILFNLPQRPADC